MIIEPKIRGYVCVTSHPIGCAQHVREQIEAARAAAPLPHPPRRVLVVGSSTGYGLAARIVAAFGAGAETFGVFYERAPSNGRPASPGYYNALAFEEEAAAVGLPAGSLNGDAFSDDVKDQVMDRLEKEMGPVDLVIYSLAAPRRNDPRTGETYKSVLKPIGQSFRGKTVDTDKNQVQEVAIEPANQEEIEATVKVMGGEDWERWIGALAERGLLAPGFRTAAFSYLGPEVTWPIYRDGTIGRAKEDLDRAVEALNERYRELGGEAVVAVNKAVVTQASSAIPVVPLYVAVLFRVMKEKGLHEGCVEQMIRLFGEKLSAEGSLPVEEDGRVHLDDREMREDVQEEVRRLWPLLHSDNLEELTDYAGYRREFLRLFGFEVDGVDYREDVDPEKALVGGSAW